MELALLFSIRFPGPAGLESRSERPLHGKVGPLDSRVPARRLRRFSFCIVINVFIFVFVRVCVSFSSDTTSTALFRRYGYGKMTHPKFAPPLIGRIQPPLRTFSHGVKVLGVIKRH